MTSEEYEEMFTQSYRADRQLWLTTCKVCGAMIPIDPGRWNRDSHYVTKHMTWHESQARAHDKLLKL